MTENIMTESELKKLENSWASKESMHIIESNWKTLMKMVERIEASRAKAIKKMLEDFGEQACMAPASSRLEFHNAFPGGLVDHSLRVMNKTIAIGKAWNVKDIPIESIIISTLFHDWGKVGEPNNPRYVHNNSVWHRQRGMIYTVNNQQFTTAHGALFIFNSYGIKLSSEEYLSIMLNDGQYVSDNKSYSMREPKLALLVHFADRWASQCEKGRTSLLDSDDPRF